MKLDYVPLLQIQRKLQGMPRNNERFKKYLATIFDKSDPQCPIAKLPPLVAANPMAKDHVTALLDEYLAMDVDGIAARTLAEAADNVADVPGAFKFALVMVDDLMGGWTNRWDYEYAFRFPFGVAPSAGSVLPKWVKDFWLSGFLWSSEPASERAAREAILTTVYRIAYTHRHGAARTLGDMMTQEGQVMAMAGCTGPTLDEEDLAYSREVLAPFLAADDKRTVMECLFGDAAGKTLGFTPRGLSPWAGMAVALADARAATTSCGHW